MLLYFIQERERYWDELKAFYSEDEPEDETAKTSES